MSSFILLDVACPILLTLMRVLFLPLRTVVRFKSFVLRRWMSNYVGHFEHISRIDLEITGDSLRGRESALIICNHRSWMDTIVLYILARHVGLHGDVKFFAKKSLLAVPVYGLAGAILSVVIFISRNFGKANRRLDKTFAMLTDPKRRWPFWMISYLEGTRRTQPKLEAAQAFAKQRDLTPLNHILQPRTKGFVASVQALRGDVGAVYDFTIGYQEADDESRDMVPNFPKQFFTTTTGRRKIRVHQRRFPIEDLPEEDEDIKVWAYKLFEDKDNLLDTFYRTGSFPGPRRPYTPMDKKYYYTCVVGFWVATVFVWHIGKLLLRLMTR